MYGELSVAHTPEEFSLVRTRLQQEWTFDGGFVSRFTSYLSPLLATNPFFITNLKLIGLVNAAMFAITTDSIFKVDSSACAAVAISSAACGLGLACDLWFLLRYSWVDSETFAVLPFSCVYDSYVFFSLSSRMPTLCTLLSSISLASFPGLIAYDATPIGVVVAGVLVVLMMILQFIVYGTHRCAMFASRVLRARAIKASEV
ncbi:hypothetical protein M413DRAFT_78631 [Hebeloma cylindrosporum]|uniref:Uncharacterized protein n=1 Tax=Hebeloma cylindrosporum TaxID=76867 RepID=A0A0C2XDU4_HEBCY|nr:hypothetical protein M413DRAFT_78631 [Hebeloma cylindrosporum h7]